MLNIGQWHWSSTKNGFVKYIEPELEPCNIGASKEKAVGAAQNTKS